MPKLVTLLALAGVLLFPHSQAFAWNDTGHMVVAEIAYRRLTPDQRRGAADLLKKHPHYQTFLIADAPKDVDVDEWAFLKAATWPDWVRSMPNDPEHERITNAWHHGAYHFINLPYVPRAEDQARPEFKNLEAPEPNILTALAEFISTLKNADAPGQDRAVALCWVLHLVGDIHQPLHCTQLYSPDYPKGDQGGNLEAILFNDRPMRLHAFWDDVLGTGVQPYYIAAIADRITEAPECGPEKLKGLMDADKTFPSWAKESFRDADAFAYLGGDLRTVRWSDWQEQQIPKEKVPALPPGYEANARDVARRRVALAGYRLADQLVQVLK